MDKNISFCGVDCSECSDFKSGVCPSCRLTEWKDGDICMPVKCCTEKWIGCCAFCEGFPCGDIADFYKESDGHRRAYEKMCEMRKRNM
ncbi:MAG: hypothetical protein IJR90_07050 [Clostridia bacterium]|nr:hypothetical protein [Clostridia bacterium]